MIKKYWFLLGILCGLLGGYFFSGIGIAANPRNITSTGIIICLFFIAGIMLPSDSIRSGIKEYRLHIYVQLFIFVFIPGFIFLTTLPFRDILEPRVFTGLFAVACLPTTISSCIVFTHISGGNVVGSMFNSSVANVLGIFISPLLLSFLLKGAGYSMSADELLRVLSSLSFKMLVPVVVGQIARIWLKKVISTIKPYVNTGSNILIIIIIFFSFSKTAANPMFSAYLKSMLFPFCYLAIVHILFAAAAYKGGGLIGLSRESRISAMYTASQKSAAMGVPFVTSFFTDSPELLGIVLLPVIFYHSWQLVTAGVIKTLPFIREGIQSPSSSEQ